MSKYDIQMTIDHLLEMVNKIKRLQRGLRDCRNELCLKCGRYKDAHKGACEDCRYESGGEWSVDLDE